MKCPGQDSRYWDGEAVFEAECPKCNTVVEFFKDDSIRKCSGCGHKMLNPKNDFGCAAYCQYAEQCLGELPPELLAGKQDLLKERVAVEMKKYFDGDFKRIGHAGRVARYVDRIGTMVMDNCDCKGACSRYNPAVAGIAAYLHDIGIKEAERKYNSSSAKFQHEEGPPVARQILEELNANEGLVEEICDIVGHHHSPRDEETLNFKVLYDADLITNLEEKHSESPADPEHLDKIFSTSFLTDEGAEVARAVLSK